VDQIAVASVDVLLQLVIDGQQMAGEQIGAILGVLEAQSRFQPGHQLHRAERLGEVIIRAGRKHLSHVIGSAVR
jgi:hypothetical protein